MTHSQAGEQRLQAPEHPSFAPPGHTLPGATAQLHSSPEVTGEGSCKVVSPSQLGSDASPGLPPPTC